MLVFRPNSLVIIPLYPKRIMSPMPFEMDGISIGKTKMMPNRLLNLIFVLSMQAAKK